MPRYDDAKSPGILGYLLRLIGVFLILAVLGLIAYALVGDLSRPLSPRSIAVPLADS